MRERERERENVTNEIFDVVKLDKLLVTQNIKFSSLLSIIHSLTQRITFQNKLSIYYKLQSKTIKSTRLFVIFANLIKKKSVFLTP